MILRSSSKVIVASRQMIILHFSFSDWVSVKGHKPDSSDENWSSFLTIGSMVRYAVDLPLLLTVTSQSNDAKINFNKKVFLNDMKFFYMDDCGSIAMSRVNSDMKNAIYKLIRHLENEYCVKVQKGYLKDLASCFELSLVLLSRIKNVYSIFNRTDDPEKSKSVLAEMLRYIFFMSSHSLPMILYGLTKNSGERLPHLVHDRMMKKRMQLRKQFEELLGDDGVLIFPSFISTALYPQEAMYNICNFAYVVIFNTLGLPVTQCPLGYNRNHLPVGLQIVANPGCDHLSIAVAQEIERTFGGWKEPAQGKHSIT
ncbi:hypothetical protein HN011_003632 [Eciton burchellii]|nr:hypothetical protein HN011_003632 [Eciton burchellii]